MDGKMSRTNCPHSFFGDQCSSPASTHHTLVFLVQTLLSTSSTHHVWFIQCISILLATHYSRDPKLCAHGIKDKSLPFGVSLVHHTLHKNGLTNAQVNATITSILVSCPLLGMPGEHAGGWSLFIMYEYHYLTTKPCPTSCGLQGAWLAGLL